MRVVVAADAFKECLDSPAVCLAIAQGVRRADPDADVRQVPLSDGGPGTVEALVRATWGRFESANVTGPMGETVRARFGIVGDGTTAVLEMASASGLELVPIDRRDPLRATTRGTGELIAAALDLGVRRVLIGIGGSATNDGGAGLAQALGYRLLDANGGEIGPGGGALAALDRIDASARDPRLDGLIVNVACDVTNPLTGPQGASAIYGPQKGADKTMVAQLDRNLNHFADVVRRDLGIEIESISGAGAAGGLGGGLMAFCGGRLRRGIELVMDAVGLRDHLAGADLCLTGEGSLDHQSPFGKTAAGVARLGEELGVPVVALAGAVKDARALLDGGMSAYFGITRQPCTLATAVANAPQWLADAAEQVVRLFLAARRGTR